MRTLDKIKSDIKDKKEELKRLENEYEEVYKSTITIKDFFDREIKVGDRVIYGKTGPNEGGRLGTGRFDGVDYGGCATIHTDNGGTIGRSGKDIIKLD